MKAINYIYFVSKFCTDSSTRQYIIWATNHHATTKKRGVSMEHVAKTADPFSFLELR